MHCLRIDRIRASYKSFATSKKLTVKIMKNKGLQFPFNFLKIIFWLNVKWLYLIRLNLRLKLSLLLARNRRKRMNCRENLLLSPFYPGVLIKLGWKCLIKSLPVYNCFVFLINFWLISLFFYIRWVILIFL